MAPTPADELVPGVGAHLARLAADLTGLSDAERWRRVREEFLLDRDILHFNTGSTGACPAVVVDAVAAAVRAIEADPLSHVFSSGLGSGMQAVRERAAALLHADVDEITLTRNTTEGMNQVALGIDWQPGDEVLMTNQEHGGGVVGWEHLRRHRGVQLRYVPMPIAVRDADQVVDLVAQHLTERTRVVSLMHIDTNTGMEYPLARIAELTRPRGILLVCDGAHGPGMLRVDVQALGVDTYASSSHKWLLAPKGNGLLYVSKDAKDRVQPVFTLSGTQPYSASSGTRDVAGLLGHGVAIDFHTTLGVDAVEARHRELNARLRARLQDHPRLRVVTPPEMGSAILTAGVEGMTSAEVMRTLRERHRVTTKACQPTYPVTEDPAVQALSQNNNCLRLSTHLINDEAQVDRLADLLDEIVV